MDNNLRTKAVVLHRTNYGESDRILQLLTEHGRFSVLAKGARKEKSKLAGGIEMFCLCDVTIRKGKGEIHSLTSARTELVWHNFLNNYERTQFSYEVIKQINRVTSAVDDIDFFELLIQCLTNINDILLDIRLVKIWFWIQIGILSGTGLNLSIDSRGYRLEVGKKYNFDVSQSSFVESISGKFTADHIRLLRVLSANDPHVAQRVIGLEELINDCLWVAERSMSH
jgi:recombinational DNA repair protein (RecF pathway)